MDLSDDALKAAWAGSQARPHPSEEDLLAYLEGDRGQVLEAHLARCAACLGLLGELERLVSHVAPRRAFPKWTWAAAAGLLAACAWWGVSGRPPSIEKKSVLPEVAGVAYEVQPLPASGIAWMAKAGEVQAVLGESVAATLRQGSILKVGENPLELTLERGAVRLDSPGERVVLRVGEFRVELSDADLVAELSRPALASWLLPEAAADEGPRLSVLRGSVTAGTRTLKAGESLGEAVSWRGDAVWSPLITEVAVIRDARRVFLPDPPASGYVFEALVRKRHSTAEVGLSFQAGQGSWQMPIGGNLLPARAGWSRVRLEVSPAWCRATLGMRELLSCPPERLLREASPVSGEGVGLKAWGGDLEVREARWRTLK